LTGVHRACTGMHCSWSGSVPAGADHPCLSLRTVKPSPSHAATCGVTVHASSNLLRVCCSPIASSLPSVDVCLHRPPGHGRGQQAVWQVCAAAGGAASRGGGSGGEPSDSVSALVFASFFLGALVACFGCSLACSRHISQCVRLRRSRLSDKLVIQLWTARKKKNETSKPLRLFAQSPVTFDDVAGVDEAKEELKEIVVRVLPGETAVLDAAEGLARLITNLSAAQRWIASENSSCNSRLRQHRSQPFVVLRQCTAGLCTASAGLP
jgi:hypothetical protein